MLEVRQRLPEGVCRLEGSVLWIVLAARGGAGEKCVVFEASWQPQERVQKPPYETDPRHTLLYEKKKKRWLLPLGHMIFLP